MNRLAKLRKSRNLNQMALAEKSGINLRQIQKIEANESKMENLALKTAVALAEALQIEDLRELLKD